MSPRRNRRRRDTGYHVHPDQWTCVVCGTWFAKTHVCPGPEAPLTGQARLDAIANVRAAIHAAQAPPAPAPVQDSLEGLA